MVSLCRHYGRASFPFGFSPNRICHPGPVMPRNFASLAIRPCLGHPAWIGEGAFLATLCPGIQRDPAVFVRPLHRPLRAGLAKFLEALAKRPLQTHQARAPLPQLALCGLAGCRRHRLAFGRDITVSYQHMSVLPKGWHRVYLPMLAWQTGAAAGYSV